MERWKYGKMEVLSYSILPSFLYYCLACRNLSTAFHSRRSVSALPLKQAKVK